MRDGVLGLILFFPLLRICVKVPNTHFSLVVVVFSLGPGGMPGVFVHSLGSHSLAWYRIPSQFFQLNSLVNVSSQGRSLELYSTINILSAARFFPFFFLLAYTSAGRGESMT